MFQIKKSRGSRKNGRAGYSLIELSIAFIIIALIMAGLFQIYKKLANPTKAEGAFKQIVSVVAGAERAKYTNGGVFPVGNGLISVVTVVENELGGAANSQDVASWSYSCPVGTSQTLTITTDAFEDPLIATLASAKFNSNNAPWTSVAAGSIVTITLVNVTCN